MQTDIIILIRVSILEKRRKPKDRILFIEYKSKMQFVQKGSFICFGTQIVCIQIVFTFINYIKNFDLGAAVAMAYLEGFVESHTPPHHYLVFYGYNYYNNITFLPN